MDRRDFSRSVDPAYLSNGLIGIRPGPVPLVPAPACVAGFVFRHPAHHVESLSPAPYPLATDIRVNGAGLLETPGRARVESQRLDMRTGELTTRFALPHDGGRLMVTVVQFASRSVPALLCQEVSIEADSAATIEVEPRISATGIPGKVENEAIPERAETDGLMLFTSLGDLSRLGISLRIKADPSFTRRQGSSVLQLRAKPGETYRLQTIAAMVSSFYHREPQIQAIRMANWGLQVGPTVLREQNRQAWEELWKGRVTVSGPAEDQRVLDAAFFYLHSSVHPSNLNGMPPFGLSQTEHYYGHSFWDTETWSLLPVLLTSPAAAKSLLEFRVRGLDAAKRTAALFGYRGAQFPWEAAPTDGTETTPTFAATGWSEQHVVPDVALAFWQYQLATGDAEFLRRGTWPVLRNVAEWIESRGVRTPRGFEIHNIMGPNEGINGLNNSAFVNLACKMVLQSAVHCARLIGEEPPASWQRTADTIVLPIDAATGAMTTYEGTPGNAFADISFLYVFDVPVDAGTLAKTFQAYKAAAHPEHSIGFATAPQAALAAVCGDRQMAARLFREAWKPFWMEPFGMIKETAEQTYGCFVTDYGSLLESVMLGFTGLRASGGEWNGRPAALPANWEAIEIGRIWIRGQPKRVTAEHGQRARIADA